MWNVRAIVLLMAVGAPAAVLWPVWREAGLCACEDDVLYYFPTRVFFGEAIARGEWPALNPWTGLGRPFVADPQTAVWYPTTWLFVSLDPLRAYGLSLYLHYCLGLWGAYRLLRAERVQPTAAVLGAVVFALAGFMVAHRVHFTMQHAAAWAPIVFWRLDRYVTTRERSTWRLVLATLALSAQCFAGHVQVVALTMLGAVVWLMARRWTGWVGQGVRLRLMTLRVGLVCMATAAVFAVQWLPTAEYLRQCTRTEHSYGQFTENSWSIASAVNWVLPMLFGQRTPNFFGQAYWGPSHQCEQFAYFGLVPLVLVAAVLWRGWRVDGRVRAWGGLAGFALLVALGEYGPACPVLYWLPGGSLFRCPARALLLFNLAAAALTALAVNWLCATPTAEAARLRAMLQVWTDKQRIITIGIGLLVIAAVVLGLALLSDTAREPAWMALRLSNPAIWVPAAMVVVSLMVLGWVVRRPWPRGTHVWPLLAVTLIDLAVVGWTLDVPADARTPAARLTPTPPSDWIELVRKSRQRLWVLTSRVDGTPGEYVDPVEKVVANTNILRGIPSLTDYGPLQPRGYVQTFEFRPWGESERADELLADTRWMRACNVGWVLLCNDQYQAPADCEPVLTTRAGRRLFRHSMSGGLAVMADPTVPAALHTQRLGNARLRTQVDTWPEAAPAVDDDGGMQIQDTWPRLVLSHLALPGWSAWINGHPVAIEAYGDVPLLSVRVPPGVPVVVNWRYETPGLAAGARISLAAGVVLLLAGVWSRVRRTGATNRVESEPIC